MPWSPWPLTYATVGRTSVALRHTETTSPDAEPAVALHGLGGSSLNWTDLAGELRDRLDLVAPDLPGHGWSPPPDDGDYSVAAHARTMVAVIELGATPVHLLGNSLGGAVAVRIAATRPDLVRTLTLVSPALPDLRLRRDPFQVGLVGLPGLGQVIARQLKRLTPEQRVHGLLELCFGDPTLVSPEARAAATEEIVRRSRLPYADDAIIRSTRGVVTAYLDRGPGNLWRLAARIQAPTLAIYGRRDRLVHPRSAARIRQVVADATVVTLPQAGHVAQIEMPALVASMVREHITKQPASASASPKRSQRAPLDESSS